VNLCDYQMLDMRVRNLPDTPSDQVQLAKALASARYGNPMQMVPGFAGIPIKAWRAVIVEANAMPFLRLDA
jgi:hypothetical protein